MKSFTSHLIHKSAFLRNFLPEFVAVFIFPASVSAHSLGFSNLQVHEMTSSLAKISFNIQWEDSWHYNTVEPKNFDATWVFAKYLATDGNWHHVKLNGYVAHATAEINLPADKLGAFIYKRIEETEDFFEGDVSFENVTLKWNLSAASAFPPAEPYQLRLFGIEMCYIPKASFYVGVDSIAGGDAPFFDYDSLGSEGYTTTLYTYIMNPFPKTLISTGKASLAGGFPQIASSTQYKPAYNNFPNGYNGFFCMKYEINQQQYAHFLNTLIPAGTDVARYCDPVTELGHDCSRMKRYTLHFDIDSGKYSTDFPNLPVEYLGWEDGTAYADWAALRPMTEMEYEKICRGPSSAYQPSGLDYDYAYGVGSPENMFYQLNWIDDGTNIYDTIYNLDTAANNLFYRSTWAKLDFCDDEPGEELVGFAQNGTLAHLITSSGSSLTRYNTGATYYGVMEMSGNLNERCIGIKERWVSSEPDANTATPEYDWPADNIPSCGGTGYTFITVNVDGVTRYYKDCPSLFKGKHGNGELDAAGFANVTGWPNENGNGAGAMNRGGRWNQLTYRCLVADRMPLAPASARTHESTMRFVRTF